MQGMKVYGPNTAAVQALLKRAAAATQVELFQLQQAYWLTRGEDEHKHLRMPRDFAWKRHSDGLVVAGQERAFDALWTDMAPLWTSFQAGSAIQDAACALLLADRLGEGPFRLADFDVLMSPWRAGVDDDPRSRLALTVLHTYPHEVDDEWWAVIDAALTPAES